MDALSADGEVGRETLGVRSRRTRVRDGHLDAVDGERDVLVSLGVAVQVVPGSLRLGSAARGGVDVAAGLVGTAALGGGALDVRITVPSQRVSRPRVTHHVTLNAHRAGNEAQGLCYIPALLVGAFAPALRLLP